MPPCRRSFPNTTCWLFFFTGGGGKKKYYCWSVKTLIFHALVFKFFYIGHEMLEMFLYLENRGGGGALCGVAVAGSCWSSISIHLLLFSWRMLRFVSAITAPAPLPPGDPGCESQKYITQLKNIIVQLLHNNVFRKHKYVGRWKINVLTSKYHLRCHIILSQVWKDHS